MCGPLVAPLDLLQWTDWHFSIITGVASLKEKSSIFCEVYALKMNFTERKTALNIARVLY